ncbi:hypothetical protein PoB_003469700 [Plakobranchus ocellatus]|uniref:Uncharacterized protein n=1 Tax=Plakobranchus ocellatus TaxID=259542 RepID=A0AAV4AMJ2_9GAST|nr:hypothetical protein PoB_003469700 [Plakobranchus ocellatus]
MPGGLSPSSQLSAHNPAIEILWPEQNKDKNASLKEEIRHSTEVIVLIHFTSLKFLALFVWRLKRQLSHETARAFLPLYCEPAHPSLSDLTDNKLCKKLMALGVKVLTARWSCAV